MPEIVLRYKGYSLAMHFPTSTYYLRQEFEPGKTLYQILFEHLIDGRQVVFRDLERDYKAVDEGINNRQIKFMVDRISAAVKNSPKARLRAKAFVLTRWGGRRNPVFQGRPPIPKPRRRRRL